MDCFERPVSVQTVPLPKEHQSRLIEPFARDEQFLHPEFRGLPISDIVQRLQRLCLVVVDKLQSLEPPVLSGDTSVASAGIGQENHLPSDGISPASSRGYRHRHRKGLDSRRVVVFHAFIFNSC